MPIKANVNTDVKHNNWSSVGNHIKRTQYKNSDVDLSLSQYNKYSDGRLVFDKSFNPNNPSFKVYPHGSIKPTGVHFKYNKNYYRINHYKKSLIRRHANKNGWLKNHNRKVIRQGHRKRVITPNQLFYGRGKMKHDPTHTITVGFGSASSHVNNHCVNLIQHAYKRGHHEAKRRYIKTMSLANANIARLWNRHFKYLKLLHWGTNADERMSPTSKNMDAIHLHGQVISLAWSSLDKHGNPNRYKSGKRKGKLRGKPSFNMDKALKMEYHTNSIRTAMKRFRKDEDNFALSIYQRTLAKHFSRVSAFKQPFILTRTHSNNTGRSMTQYKHDERIHERMQAKINSLHYQLDKIKRHHNQIKPLNSYNQHKVSSASSSATAKVNRFASNATSYISSYNQSTVDSYDQKTGNYIFQSNLALDSLKSAGSSMSSSLAPLSSSYRSLSNAVSVQNVYYNNHNVPINAQQLYHQLPDKHSKLFAYGRYRYGTDDKAPTLKLIKGSTLKLDNSPKHIKARLLISSSISNLKSIVANQIPNNVRNWIKRYYIKLHDKMRSYAKSLHKLFHKNKYDNGWLMSNTTANLDGSIYLGKGASVLGHKYDKRIDGFRKDITPTPSSSASSANSQSINKVKSMKRNKHQSQKASQLNLFSKHKPSDITPSDK